MCVKYLLISFLHILTSDYKLGIILNGYHIDYPLHHHPSIDTRTSYLHFNFAANVFKLRGFLHDKISQYICHGDSIFSKNNSGSTRKIRFYEAIENVYFI